MSVTQDDAPDLVRIIREADGGYCNTCVGYLMAKLEGRYPDIDWLTAAKVIFSEQTDSSWEDADEDTTHPLYEWIERKEEDKREGNLDGK